MYRDRRVRPTFARESFPSVVVLLYVVVCNFLQHTTGRGFAVQEPCAGGFR